MIGPETQGINGDPKLSLLPADDLEFGYIGVLLQLVAHLEGDPSQVIAAVGALQRVKARMGTSSMDRGLTRGWETPGGILS